jgi:hypothetical protein
MATLNPSDGKFASTVGKDVATLNNTKLEVVFITSSQIDTLKTTGKFNTLYYDSANKKAYIRINNNMIAVNSVIESNSSYSLIEKLNLSIPSVNQYISYDTNTQSFTYSTLGDHYVSFFNNAIFGYGTTSSDVTAVTNKVNGAGVVSVDTTGVGTARTGLAAAGYGGDKAIFGYGYTSSYTAVTNKVDNTGTVSDDTAGVGTARARLAAASYGGDNAIFGYGTTSSDLTAVTNKVNGAGVVSNDTTGVGTARSYLAAAGYGGDKAIFGYGIISSNNCCDE